MPLFRETGRHHFRLFILLLIPLAVILVFAAWVSDVAKHWFGGSE